MEGRISIPRIQALESKGTTNKGREESRGQTDKVGEHAGIIQPSPIPSKKGTPVDEKDKGKDEPLEKSLESKHPEKNAGTTYQRLVDTIFEGQMGRNLKAYVDGMVMKRAEEAFYAMKKLIAELPTLTAPKKEEELMVYLSAANEAVSAVLLVKKEGRQAPIHYVSRTLQGAEINYPPMESWLWH
nr:reverse transcriptase domain-containing protein [Tanacetum cinerariifolium]